MASMSWRMGGERRMPRRESEPWGREELGSRRLTEEDAEPEQLMIQDV
jgi:hypothetical protein